MIVQLTKVLDQFILREGAQVLGRYALTPEYAELFGHREHLYFEATVNQGAVTLGTNVAPPRAQ